VANFAVAHFAADLAPHLVVALAGDHVPAAAQIEKPVAVLLSLLLLARLPHRALAAARQPALALCHPLGARAKHLHAVRMAGL
jgi:hypothetical protein